MRDGPLHGCVPSPTFSTHLTFTYLKRLVERLHLDAHLSQLLIYFLRCHRGVHIICCADGPYVLRLVDSSWLLCLNLGSIFLVVGEGALPCSRVELVAPWSSAPHHVLRVAGSLCA